MRSQATQHRTFSTQPPVKTYFAHEQARWTHLSRSVKWSTYASTLFAIGIGYVYINSFETDPLIGLRRVNMVRIEKNKRTTIATFEDLLFDAGIWDLDGYLRTPFVLSEDGPPAALAKEAFQKLVDSNNLGELGLEVYVLDSPSRSSFIVSPAANLVTEIFSRRFAQFYWNIGTKVIVHSGELLACQASPDALNVDDIAPILCNRIAHEALYHPAEIGLTLAMLLGGALPALTFAKLAWSYRKTRVIAIPFLVTYFAAWSLAMRRWHQMLSEEDRVGLIFLARAGNDLQKAMACWQRQAEVAKTELAECEQLKSVGGMKADMKAKVARHEKAMESWKREVRTQLSPGALPFIQLTQTIASKTDCQWQQVYPGDPAKPTTAFPALSPGPQAQQMRLITFSQKLG
jgi:hypothetical protein